MMAQSPQRRNLFIAFGLLFVLSVIFYSAPAVDTERFKNIIPSYGDGAKDSPATTEAAKPNPTSASDSGNQDDKTDETNSNAPAIPDDTTPDDTTPAETPSAVIEEVTSAVTKETASAVPEDAASDPQDANSDEEDAVKTSKFHYLIPASGKNRRLCFNIVSSAANQYPVPALMGWNGQGLLDAHATHLAKLRAIERYLNSLGPEEDEDIVLIVDGYDIILQLPPDIMLERYFEVVESENKRTAERFGITVDQVYEGNLQTTLFFGPDKICWPINWKAPRCWAVPDSTLPSKAFGPKTNNGEMTLMLPKWLNSGTLIGPAGHMRAYISATMYEIMNSWNPDNMYKDSDQFYLANVWGRQEYFRSLKLSKDGTVPGGPSDRMLPTVYNKKEEVEFHVGIEYESSMFQTKAGYERFVDWIHYTGAETPTATMSKDLFSEGDQFKPYSIEMPKRIEESLSKIYDNIPEAHPGSTSKDWIRNVFLGTNFVTKHIWALWHVTGDKGVIEDQYTKFWFYPFARSLVKATVKKLQMDNRISDKLIGGRYWVHKSTYPDAQTLTDPMGGAWSDEHGGTWMNFQDMCGDFEIDALGGEKAIPAATEKVEEHVEEKVEVNGEVKVDEKVGVNGEVKVDENVGVNGEVKVDENVGVNGEVKVDENVAVKVEEKVEEKVDGNNPASA